MSEMSSLEKLVEQTKANPLERENWIALGKALGWDEHDAEMGGQHYCLDWTFSRDIELYDWEACAHHYLDLVLTGGDTEAFWRKILNDKQ